MSEPISLEKMAWRMEALERKVNEEAATRYFVKEAVQAATSPINDSLINMQRTIEKMADQIKDNHETQSVLMKERGEREKAEYEARMERQAEKHKAEMEIAEANLEEAKNQTFFHKITKQWHPVLLFLAALAVIFNQIILPVIHAMNAVK